MPNGLMTFNFDGVTVRTVTGIDGETWFVAADALHALTLDRKALERLDDEDKGVSSIHTLGGEQSVTTINESGVYGLVLGSRKPGARKFKRWVTADVLPSIRRTGAYAPAAADPMQVLNDPAAMRGLLLGYTEKVLELQSQVGELTPKAQALDLIEASEESLTATQAGKLVGMGARALYALTLDRKALERLDDEDKGVNTADPLSRGRAVGLRVPMRICTPPILARGRARP